MPADDRSRTPDDVSVAEMERLVSLALGRGGDFADLYFEHRRTSSLFLEEGILRTADTLGRLYIRPNLQGGGQQNENPLQSLQNIQREDLTNRFIGGATVRYTPTNWLEMEGAVGYDGRTQQYSQFQDKGYRATVQSFAATQSIGSVFRGAQEWEGWNANLTANLRGTHLNGDLRSRATLRYLFERQDYEFRQASGNTLAVQGVTTLNNTTLNRVTSSSRETQSLIGLAGGVNLDYRTRYIVDLLLRRDGSSLFGEDNRWQTFGRASLGWRVGRESWWPSENTVSEFKLRASYGTSGGRPPFSAQYETFTIGTGGIVSPVQLGNANLGPERNTELELGTDIELFRRALINVTYADSRTEDQILPAPVQSATGFTTQWLNAGTLRNKTWEFALSVPLVQQRGGLNWQVGATYSSTRSVIEQLDVPPYSYGTGLQATDAMFRAQEGERFGTFYGRAFARSCSQLPEPYRSDCGGSATSFQYNDEGYVVWVGSGNSWRDGITSNLWQEALPASRAPGGTALNFGLPITLRDSVGTARQVPLGNALPDYVFSINTTLQWKRFTVYGLLDAAMGQDVWNQGRHWAHLDFLAAEIDQEGKSVESAKPLGYYWRAGNTGGIGGFYDILAPNSHFVEDASYAKLRELLVSYAVGPVMGFGNWEMAVIGRNLFTITDYKGFDAEVGPGCARCRWQRSGRRCRRHAQRRERPGRHPPGQGEDRPDRTQPSPRRHHQTLLRPEHAHRADHRHLEAGAGRGNHPGRPGPHRFPLALPQHPDCNLPLAGLDLDFVHPHATVRHHLQYHVPERHCHRHRRPGRCRHRHDRKRHPPLRTP